MAAELAEADKDDCDDAVGDESPDDWGVADDPIALEVPGPTPPLPIVKAPLYDLLPAPDDRADGAALSGYTTLEEEEESDPEAGEPPPKKAPSKKKPPKTHCPKKPKKTKAPYSPDASSEDEEHPEQS